MWNLLKSEKRIKKDFLIIPLSIPIHHNTDKECSKIYHPIAEKNVVMISLLSLLHNHILPCSSHQEAKLTSKISLPSIATVSY